jgi:DNA-binding LacI/PurR family transcriptional regulator
MADVARAAGVSKQTVSRALRGAAGISDKTRKKIIGLAGRMGYRPNPLTAALMTDIRRRKQNDTGTTILMLHDLEREPASYGNERGLTLVAYYHAAKARAEQLGYHLDTLGYAEPGMTGERIDGILKARGIRGVYITGRSPVPDLDWDHYAVVCGRRPGIPCYSVLPDCPYNMELALRQACDLGYRRVGLVLDPDYDASVEYFGAYHSFRYAHRDLRLLEPFDCGGQDTEARLNRWFDRQKPDLILTLWTGSPFCQTIEDRVRNAPEHIGLVVLGLPPAKPYLAGIDYCLTTCAESAINLLHEQLINNRFGKLPIAARILHIRGEWHSGQTAFCQTR